MSKAYIYSVFKNRPNGTMRQWQLECSLRRQHRTLCFDALKESAHRNHLFGVRLHWLRYAELIDSLKRTGSSLNRSSSVLKSVCAAVFIFLVL